MDINGKVAIVTGGTGGIGFCTAEALLRHGARFVAMFDLESSKNRGIACIEKLENELGRGCAAFYPCDVTDANQFKEQYDNIVLSQKTVDILINNAGILNDRKTNLTIDLNLKSVINCTLHAIDQMGKHKGGIGGVVLNVASVSGLVITPIAPVYNASKSGVIAFTRTLKEQYGHTKVRVVAVCPGATETDMFYSNVEEVTLPIIKFDPVEFLERNKDLIIQPPKHVAVAVIKMIEEAEPGALWVSEENQPPYAIADPPFYRSRKVHQTLFVSSKV